ncbi:intracellular protein transport protein USO1-like [Nicotiana sylvestris]|uniref:intracellular protein transport protein USO1-like n=1 Tax=Nicotiana sylvestris TaxID=4096 RepID=UPI00388C9F0B
MSAPPGNWEGQSTTRPPLFNGLYYFWWKNRMRDHIMGEDYELWDIVTDGPLATTKKTAEGLEVPKTRADCTAEDLKKWEKNVKAKKWLVCGLGPDEYSRIQSYNSAKEIWDTLQVAHKGTPQVKRIILEEDKVEKILTRVLPIAWESKITAIQESKNTATLKLDELIGNLTAYELRRQTMKMDAPKKERSLTLRISEGSDLEDDEIAMITRDFKKYLMRGKGSSRGTTFNKPRAPEKQTNEGCFKCGKTDHMIKNCPQWEIEWKKERAERRNRKKEQGENSDEDSENEAEDEQALMAIGESNDEQEVSILHLKDKIKFLSKERLAELLLEFIDESEIVNNEKEVLSRECVILKAKCKSLESRADESDNKNAELKNQVLELDNSILEHRSENLKLKLGTGKKKADHSYLTLEENLGKMKDELYKKDELIKVLKEDLGKVKHELDRTCKWNKVSDALSWLQEHHSSNKRGLGYGTQAPKWDPKSKYLTLLENKVCTHCGKTGHYKSECNTKEKASQKNKAFVQEKHMLHGWVQVKGKSQIWYMDSGCSKHMTGNKDQFLSLEDLKGGNVIFGNGKKGGIIGVGKVGKTDSHSIENVYLIDGLKYSLISVSQLCDRGNQLASIRSDHGTEFENAKFAEYCDENGVDHNFSAPRTPQQNGVVERKNRTLEDMEGTMLISSKLPHSFWAEAEHEDEAIGLVKELIESTTQVKVASKEGTGDGTRPSTQGNLTGGTNQGEIESNSLKEPIYEPVPQQQNKGESSSRNQLVVKSHKYQSSHPIENIITDPTSGVKTRSQLKNLCAFDAFLSLIELKDVVEALQDADWVNAMQDELNQFKRSQVWHLVPRPKDRSVIGTKWVFRNKLDEDGIVTRNKARLVVQGYSQEEGIDYDETFAPEEVFVKQPPGFESKESLEHVYKLDKALYGLKQAPRTWYERLSKFLLEHGYKSGKIDSTLFLRLSKDFAKLMGSEFEMSMMGELNFFLGLQIKQSPNGTMIHKQKYTKELIKKFKMEDSKEIDIPIATATKLDVDEPGSSVDQKLYRGMIGSLLYLTTSRPDIVFSVGICARFQAIPKESHLTAIKRILRYLKGTTDLKSTSGMTHFLGSCLVSWATKKQNSVALSTAKAEYVVAASCCAQLLWIKQQLVDFGIQVRCIPIFCDNTSVISMTKNSVHYKRTKHIDVRHHFLRDNYEKGLISIKFCAIDKQIADIFTKALSKENFERNRLELGMIKIT